MKAVVDRIVQYANRYQLTNVETGEVLGTFDFEEVTGTVQQVGTEIDKELFDSIANDLAARVKLSGGELAETIVTFPDISDTAANVASGDTSATLWGKVKNWFSRLKALAFKNKVAAGDFEAGAIKNADVAADAAIAQSKVSGLMTDYVASIGVSGRTLTFKNKSGATMGTATTQDTTYGLASQSSNGLMSATDKTKLDGINEVLNNKANTSGSYPNLTVGKATNADNATNATKATQDASGNVITSTYATKNELTSGLNGKANTSGTYPNLTVGKATADEDGNVINATYAKRSQVVRKDVLVGAINSVSDAGKNWLANKQVMTSGTQINASGWYRIALIPSYCNVKFNIFKQYNYDVGTTTTITIDSGIANRNYVLINVENTLAGDNSKNYVKQVRFSDSSANYSGYLDVYIEAGGQNAYWLTVDAEKVYNTNFEIYDFESVTEAVVDNVIIVDVPKTGGSNTNKPIYQQGRPVLVGDQNAIFESDGTTVKKATKATNADNVKTNINGKAITDIFESNGTTVKKATIAQYASSDTSKGTIEERLTSLGFKVGNINLSSDVSASLGAGGIAPAIIKLGNMCYIFGRYTHDGVGSSFVIGTIPEEFRPKDNTFAMWYVSGYAGENVYCGVSINSSSGEITASNDSGRYALDYVDFLGSYDANTKTVQFAQIAYGV